jgi:hypothetical protein
MNMFKQKLEGKREKRGLKCILFFAVIFETKSHCIAQAGLELKIP